MMMKPLGAAAHPLEETIEQVIRDAPLFRGGRGMVYGPVSGGISNENWRVQATDGSGDWFVKVPGQGTEMFIDRRAALDASQKAAAAGLGPRVHADLAHRGVEINDFLPDHRPSTHSDFACRDKRVAAIAAIAPALRLVTERQIAATAMSSPASATTAYALCAIKAAVECRCQEG